MSWLRSEFLILIVGYSHPDCRAILLDFRFLGLASAITFGRDHINQLPAPGDEFGQGTSLLVGYPPCLWLHTLCEQREDPGIQCIGLRELTSSTGKVSDLTWVDDDDRKVGCRKDGGELDLVATRRLEDDQGKRKADKMAMPLMSFANVSFVPSGRK